MISISAGRSWFPNPNLLSKRRNEADRCNNLKRNWSITALECIKFTEDVPVFENLWTHALSGNGWNWQNICPCTEDYKSVGMQNLGRRWCWYSSCCFLKKMKWEVFLKHKKLLLTLEFQRSAFHHWTTSLILLHYNDEFVSANVYLKGIGQHQVIICFIWFCSVRKFAIFVFENDDSKNCAFLVS